MVAGTELSAIVDAGAEEKEPPPEVSDGTNEDAIEEAGAVSNVAPLERPLPLNEPYPLPYVPPPPYPLLTGDSAAGLAGEGVPELPAPVFFDT